MKPTAIEVAQAICEEFEGFSPRPYLCPAGVPTIGYGTTVYPNGKRVSLSDPPISRDEALALLSVTLEGLSVCVLRLCPTLVDNPWRQGAIIDFVYNLGPGRLQASTLRRRINQRDWLEAKRELMKWVRAGGRVLPGLVKRRAIEASLL